jgi:hypothetical protein
MFIRSFSAIATVMLLGISSQAYGNEDAWAEYKFLLGEWVGEGSGEPGKGSGGFSFVSELQGKILVRRNRAEYPAAGGKPAFTHEDLMVLYRGQGNKPPEAIYFDSEGHIINYKLAFSEDKRTLTFLSEAVPSAPRFRLSYTKEEGEKLKIRFEIAPPGKPDDFRPYITATVRRKER